jgi:glycyl-tRNA synthetase beta chain
MVREFTELQGAMGGIYARAEQQPEEVWKAIYYHYLPVGVDEHEPPSRDELGAAGVSWAAVALADKIDTLVALYGAGERPSGTRDPFGLRRQAHGAIKILIDLPELTGLEAGLSWGVIIDRAAAGLAAQREAGGSSQAVRGAGPLDESLLYGFLIDRLKHVFEARGYRYDEVNAVLRPFEDHLADVRPLDARRRLEALRAMRGSEDLGALAVLFKRVKNISREISPVDLAAARAARPAMRELLKEPAEAALAIELDRRSPVIEAAIARADYRIALSETAGLRAAVDLFFNEVFVMVEDPSLRQARLWLMAELRDLVLGLADISELVASTE